MSVTDSCLQILIAAAVLVGALGLFILCHSLARYFDRAASPENIVVGIGVVLRNLPEIRLDLHGGKTPNSKKDHPSSEDDGLSS